MNKRETGLFLVSTVLACVAAEVLLTFGDKLFRFTHTYAHESRNNANIELHDLEHHFCNGQNKMYIEHDVVRYREQPNHKYFEFKNDIVNLMEFNEHGFRGDWASRNKTKAVVLGDSFVRGTLADNTETVPAFLDRWSESTQYVNLGTNGHGPLQHVLTYQEFEADLNPTFVVLILFIGNDLKDNVAFEKWQQSPPSTVKNKTPVSIIKGALRASGFHNLTIGKLIKKARTKSSLTAQPTAGEIRLMHESLKQLTTKLKESNTPLLIGLLPSLIEFTQNESLQVSPTAYGDFVREFVSGQSAELNFSVIDLKSSLIQASIKSGTPVNEYYGWPDAHLAEIGYYEIARAVAIAINKLGLDDLDIENHFVGKTEYFPETASCPD